jgi:hypothetical protein
MILRALMLALLLFAGALPAEELELGRVYAGPLKLSAPNLGASFMLPAQWDAQLASERGPLILQSHSDASRILLETNVSVIGSPLEMLPERIEYYGLELFSPMQVHHMRSSLYYRLYDVEGSETFSQALLYVVTGSQRRAVVLYGFFAPGGYKAMRQTMLSLGDSIGFTPIRALPHHVRGLYRKIVGGHFVFYPRRGSFSEKREVWLCSDGNALLKGVYTVGNETSRRTLVRRGQWHLDENVLTLELAGGIRERYRVKEENNTLFFGGAQTFRLPNHTCN